MGTDTLVIIGDAPNLHELYESIASAEIFTGKLCNNKVLGINNINNAWNIKSYIDFYSIEGDDSPDNIRNQYKFIEHNEPVFIDNTLATMGLSLSFCINFAIIKEYKKILLAGFSFESGFLSHYSNPGNITYFPERRVNGLKEYIRNSLKYIDIESLHTYQDIKNI